MRAVDTRGVQPLAHPLAAVQDVQLRLRDDIASEPDQRSANQTLLCAESHEVINLFKLAMDHRVPARYVKNQIFTHPTMSEALNDLFAAF